MAAAFPQRALVLCLLALLAGSSTVAGQLSSAFYKKKCSNLESIVLSTMTQAVNKEPRMGASILRLFFHDCFVNVRIQSLYPDA